MKTAKYLTQILAVGFGLAAGQAQASFTIGDAGLEAFHLNWDGHDEYALAGGISLSSGGAVDYISVCTDIGGTIYLGYSYDYSLPQAFSGHSGLSPLWGKTPADANAAIQAAADIFYMHSSVLSGGSTTDKAALQLAVWEALYDTGSGSSLNLLAGRFSVDPSIGDSVAITKAEQWVSQVDLNARYVGYLLVPTPEQQNGLTAQELFYNVTPVPEPATVIAGVLLLFPFGVSTVRVLRRKVVR